MINLIPISYLNEACFLSLNEDDKKYQMVLDLAQDMLKQLLGVEFYTEIETQYQANALTPDNNSFYENSGIKKYLAWQTYFCYLKFSNVNATPTGIRTFTDENSSIATDIQMYSLEKNVLQMLNTYKGSMLNYLKLEREKDSTKFPLYRERCHEEFSFGITSVNKESDAMFKVNKSIITNE